MTTIRLFSFVLATAILSLGCSHNARPDNQLAVAPAPTCVESNASQIVIKKLQASLAEANVELAIYRAVDALHKYVQSESDPASSPEELIGKVEDLVNGHGVAHDFYDNTQDLKEKARVRYAKFAVNDLREYSTSDHLPSQSAKEVITAATNAVGRIIGMPETANLLKQLAELSKKARIMYAKEMVKSLQDIANRNPSLSLTPNSPVVIDTVSAISYAIQNGDDVSPLVADLAMTVCISKDGCKYVGRKTK